MTETPQHPDLPTARMMSWARNSAIYRLSRRMMTEKQLHDAISRKAREKFEHITDEQVKALAELAVKFGYDNRALDDTAYAEIANRQGVQAGKSKRAIAQKLVMKGVDKATTMAIVDDNDELFSAVILTRKRGFGAFRKVEIDEKRMVKELSALTRAGYGFDLARKVLAMDREVAEEVLDTSPEG